MRRIHFKFDDEGMEWYEGRMIIHLSPDGMFFTENSKLWSIEQNIPLRFYFGAFRLFLD